MVEKGENESILLESSRKTDPQESSNVNNDHVDWQMATPDPSQGPLKHWTDILEQTSIQRELQPLIANPEDLSKAINIIITQLTEFVMKNKKSASTMLALYGAHLSYQSSDEDVAKSELSLRQLLGKLSEFVSQKETVETTIRGQEGEDIEIREEIDFMNPQIELLQQKVAGLE